MKRLLWFLYNRGLLPYGILFRLTHPWRSIRIFRKQPPPIKPPWFDGCQFIFHFFCGGREYMRIGQRPQLIVPWLLEVSSMRYTGEGDGYEFLEPRWSALHLSPTAIIYPGGERLELNDD